MRAAVLMSSHRIRLARQRLSSPGWKRILQSGAVDGRLSWAVQEEPTGTALFLEVGGSSDSEHLSGGIALRKVHFQSSWRPRRGGRHCCKLAIYFQCLPVLFLESVPHFAECVARGRFANCRACGAARKYDRWYEGWGSHSAQTYVCMGVESGWWGTISNKPSLPASRTPSFNKISGIMFLAPPRSC